jgi:SAM-dependent methyltransferase
MMSQNSSHEGTYKRGDISSRLHRSRLRAILRLFDEIELGAEGMLADFGCSNGFVIECLQQGVFSQRNWRFVGWDRSDSLLAMAREKKLPRATFRHFDLNDQGRVFSAEFDVVTCFETLEHVCDYRAAFAHLYEACLQGGSIVLSVPNERGAAGIIKYFGRKLLRTNPYGDFFEGKSELGYVLRLLTNRPIDFYRWPPAAEWGPHLGFDARLFEKFIDEEYLRAGRCRLVLRRKTTLGFSLLYVLRKCRDIAQPQGDGLEFAA